MRDCERNRIAPAPKARPDIRALTQNAGLIAVRLYRGYEFEIVESGVFATILEAINGNNIS